MALTRDIGLATGRENELNRRRETRVVLPVTLYVRSSAPSFWREVETENVSRMGARVISEKPLEAGSRVEVLGFGARFTAIAIVCHCRRRREGGWSIGLQFINKSGSWIIN